VAPSVCLKTNDFSWNEEEAKNKNENPFANKTKAHKLVVGQRLLFSAKVVKCHLLGTAWRVFLISIKKKTGQIFHSL
jgi:hypothetical protein